ncbi:uncharacterized protein ACNLHF_019256 [Anomaloglossus baeobatrachus]
MRLVLGQDPSFAQNLKSANDFHHVLLQKLENELSEGRIRGPFSSPPFFNLRVSPLGVVPKKEPGKFRLIQHLSYPKGSSVNDGISEADASVSYVSFDRAVVLVRQAGKGASMAKSDIESAFRLLPVHPDCHHLLGWFVNGSYYYDTNFESFALGLSWMACPALPVCGTSFSATDPVGGARPTVWLLGHSYIFWAGQRAAYRPGGRYLGFRGLEVHWRGIRGLMWPQVLPEVVGIAQVAASPVILLIHAGGNDLCSYWLAELLTTMRSDVDKFHGFFPELVFIWSEIIPRVAWQGARDAAVVERSRRTLNARMSRFVHFKGGVVVRHRQLEGDNSSLMLPDGVHLSDIGLDIFLSGLQDGIEQSLLVMGGGRSAV